MPNRNPDTRVPDSSRSEHPAVPTYKYGYAVRYTYQDTVPTYLVWVLLSTLLWMNTSHVTYCKSRLPLDRDGDSTITRTLAGRRRHSPVTSILPCKSQSTRISKASRELPYCCCQHCSAGCAQTAKKQWAQLTFARTTPPPDIDADTSTRRASAQILWFPGDYVRGSQWRESRATTQVDFVWFPPSWWRYERSCDKFTAVSSVQGVFIWERPAFTVVGVAICYTVIILLVKDWPRHRFTGRFFPNDLNECWVFFSGGLVFRYVFVRV